MMPSVRLLDPVYLWLLAGPAALLLVWGWQLVRRRRDARRLRAHRTLPVRERHPFAGGLAFWLAVIGASALVVVALARPQALVSVTEAAGIDFVVLQDGSTSMRVTDVAPDRWQRSVAWLRAFAEVLGWRRERVALALFAHRAAPQVRLTSDPNALFFFLDHLSDEPPFRLRDDTSWDTNIEDGIAWGVKMIDRDEELHGRRLGAKAFIVVSDGQAWTGEVARALKVAQERNIRVYVVGVGTTGGGFIPQPPPQRYQEPEPSIHSVLDRQSLRAIAQAGGGAYFELGAEPDHVLALRILRDAQRLAGGALERREAFTDLYWYLLLAAAGLIGAGTLLLRERTQLWWQLAAAAVLLAALVP